MGKSFIIRNQRSLKGEITNAVLITLKSWQKLVESFENNYYKYKDTYLEDVFNTLPHNIYIAEVDKFSKLTQTSFPLHAQSSISNSINRKHKLFGITNAVLEVFIYLHKKCYTNGVIPNVTAHMMWEDYTQYKEDAAYIQYSQFYIALKKLNTHGIIVIEKEIDGKYTITLNHFTDSTTKKVNPYVYISPVVFTQEFFNLSIAAKKLFLDISMQQHTEITLKRSLDKENEQGKKAHFGGMYRFLHKKYPHQIREVIRELTRKFSCTNTPLFKICKLQKGGKNKNRYTILFASVHADFLYTKEKGDVQHRDPITPKLSYARKARFIKSLLEQMNMGEFSKDMNKFIHILKYICHGQIRNVIRGLRNIIDSNESYPKNLVYTLKKLLNQKAQYRILDVAAKEGIYPLIIQTGSKEKKEKALFDFSLHFSMYSLHNLKKIFRQIHKLLKCKFAVPVTEELYHQNYLKFKEETLFRKYAFEQGANLNAYTALEIRMREQLKAIGHKEKCIPSSIREWFMNKICKLPKEVIRVIKLPNNFNLITFISIFERLIRNGVQVYKAEQVFEAMNLQ